MTNTPPFQRFLLWLYFLLAVGVGLAALVWPDVRAVSYAPLRDFLFPNFYLNARAAMAVSLEVAAPPALEAWLKTSADAFHNQNALIQIRVTPLRGADSNQRLNAMSGLPDVWIAEAHFVRAEAGGIPYETQGAPVATDYLVWVAQRTPQNLATPLDWNTVAQTIALHPDVRLAMPPPQSMEGQGACLSAAAAFHNANTVTSEQINDPAFQAWLPAFIKAAPDLSRNPLDQLSSRPPQVDIGLLLHSDWIRLPSDVFVTQVPSRGVAFDYPYYVRTSWQDAMPDEAEARRDAAERFRTYLLGAGAQQQLAGHGLERAGFAVHGQLSSLDDATARFLKFCWRK
jgi:hypothetical protein